MRKLLVKNSLSRKFLFWVLPVTLIVFLVFSAIFVAVINRYIQTTLKNQIQKEKIYVKSVIEKSIKDLENKIRSELDLIKVVSIRPLLQRIWFEDIQRVDRDEDLVKITKECFNFADTQSSPSKSEIEDIASCFKLISNRITTRKLDEAAVLLLKNVSSAVLDDPNIYSLKIRDLKNRSLVELNQENIEKDTDKRNLKTVNETVIHESKEIGSIEVTYSVIFINKLKVEESNRYSSIQKDTDKNINDTFTYIIITRAIEVSLVVLFLIGAIWLIVYFNIILPVNSLKNEAEKISKGDLNSEVNQEYSGEIKTLSKAFERMRVSIIHQYEEIEKNTQVKTEFESIKRTVQMLAHDVRRPFSQLNCVLMLAKNNSSKISIEKYLQGVSESMAEVNLMLEELSEYSTKRVPKIEEFDISDIVVKSIESMDFGKNIKPNYKFSYHFNHLSLVLAEPLRIKRVIDNVLENALDVMGSEGDFCFSTNESEANGTISLIITNTNSTISEDHRVAIFSPFVSKKGSSGLGLAICKKIMNENQGDIYLHEVQDNSVSFALKLPRGQQLIKKYEGRYFKSSEEILLSKEKVHENKKKGKKEDIDSKLEKALALYKKDYFLENPFKILIVDDENVYISLLESHIKNSLAQKISSLYFANTIKRAKEIFSQYHPDLVIIDVDLGDKIDGFELMEVISKEKKSEYQKFCLHTNRSLFDFVDQFKKSGADLFLPKPLSKDQLLGLIIDSLRSKKEV